MFDLQSVSLGGLAPHRRLGDYLLITAVACAAVAHEQVVASRQEIVRESLAGMPLDKFLESATGNLKIADAHVAVVHEVHVEIDVEHETFDLGGVDAGSPDDVFGHVDGADRQVFLVDPAVSFALVEQLAATQRRRKDATVLHFTRDRYNRRVYATKGRAGESPIWPRKPSRKNQTPFFMIGVDAAKTAIYDRLKLRDVGPGYCHFPIGRDLEYFEQLTAERKFTRYHNGFPKQEWRKPANARNEGLDARVLAYAALHALYASGLKLPVHCDRFARMVQTRRGETPPATSGRDEAGQHRPARPTSRRARRRPMDTAPQLVWKELIWL